MTNIEFIKNNYCKLGLKQSSEILNITKGKVTYIVKKFNLTLSKEEKSKILSETRAKKQNEHDVNINNFTTEINENGAYILGLLWADGYIANNNPNTKQKYDINLECINEDMESFKTVLVKTGAWNFYYRQRKDWKPITKASTCNKELINYLIENDYKEKSFKSPDKIISKIPENLIKYFLLGMIDGDGCFYFNKKNSLRQFTISGSLNQDWSAFEKIFDNLGISYKINQRTNNKNGSSEIRVLNKINIKKIGDFIYTTINEDKIGLLRKYNKYLEIIS
jgi:hypothetical protein